MSSTQASPQANPFIRLNKALAQAGICSRRAADALILGGEVLVNGLEVRTPGTRIDVGKDVVRVKGEPVPLAQPGALNHLYLALHKPSGAVTTVHDPQGRKTVMDMLPADLRRCRPYPVGRLDCLSEGLLLLTTDGELALRLTHPRFEHPKTYHVWVRGQVTEEKLQAMRFGMRLAEGDQLTPVQVRQLRPEADGMLLEMVLRQGVNRQIRRMCRDLRLHVSRLVRLRQGPVCLGDLPPGMWRRLTDRELHNLKQSLDMSEEPA